MTAHLTRSKSTCILNFGEISQSTAEILLLPLSENKHLPCWNSTSGSNFYVCITSTCHSESAYQISSKSDHPRQSYNVSIFQDAGHCIVILLPVSVFVTSLIREAWNLYAYQYSVRYLNPWLRYYYRYFRFLETNVRHVGIILPVPIFTFAWPSACHSSSAYLILSKSDHPPRSYDVISIFQDGGHQPHWILSR